MGKFKLPGNVRNCVSHYYACECRSYRYSKMESALVDIRLALETEAPSPRMLEKLRDTAHYALCCLELDDLEEDDE